MFANEATSSEKCSLPAVQCSRQEKRSQGHTPLRNAPSVLLDPASMRAEPHRSLDAGKQMTARGKKPFRPRATVADSGNSVESLFLDLAWQPTSFILPAVYGSCPDPAGDLKRPKSQFGLPRSRRKSQMGISRAETGADCSYRAAQCGDDVSDTRTQAPGLG